jgi:hypothetical protein
MADQESKQMRTAEYWDGRYKETAPDEQLHEWYRSFDQLEDFFKEAVFSILQKAKRCSPEDPSLGVWR